MTTAELKDILLRFFVFVSLLTVLSFFLGSCTDECQTTRTYYYYEPVMKTMAEVRKEVKLLDARPIVESGKIYIFGQTLFINEPGKGIHVINNTDKSNPVPLSFINIPGNVDMAVKDNILYADSYLDIVVFDLSDVNNIKQVSRVEDVYMNHSNLRFSQNEQNMVIVDYKRVENLEKIVNDCESNVQTIWLEDGGFFAVDGIDNFSTKASVPSSQTGIGGSMARFAIYEKNLYAVDQSELYVFDITNLTKPSLDNKVNLGWGIETIFPYKDKLFIGSNTGMQIFDNSNPSEPIHLSTFAHARVCDPVVVNDNYAFVTLRSGDRCNGFVNQLDVVDIKDLENPKLVKSYPMDNPHGLGVDGNTLFICEGEFGLKVFDIADVNDIADNQLGHIQGIHAFDVIPYQNNLIMIGEEGLYQYDYTDSKKLELKSIIKVNGLNK